MALRKREPKSEDGAPAWMVTYGDMMTLLLCFFVILVALSEIKEDQKYQEVIRSLQEAFGYVGGVGQVPTDMVPRNSMVDKLQEAAREFEPNITGDSRDEGVRGRAFRITQVREGTEIAVGGRIAFDTHSAELRPQAQQLVTTLAEMLRGHNTKIDIRGHATNEPLPFGTPYRDKLDLSYERARAVAEALVAAGVRRERIRIVAAGATEPLLRQAYDEERRAQNRRVEITVRESLVSEFSGDEVSFEEQVNNGQGK